MFSNIDKKFQPLEKKKSGNVENSYLTKLPTNIYKTILPIHQTQTYRSNGSNIPNSKRNNSIHVKENDTKEAFNFLCIQPGESPILKKNSSTLYPVQNKIKSRDGSPSFGNLPLKEKTNMQNNLNQTYKIPESRMTQQLRVFDERSNKNERPKSALTHTLKSNEHKQSAVFTKDYQYEKVLGHGAFATVKLAKDKKSNSLVAIKIYDKSKLSHPQRMKSVRREIDILKTLNHPNIVQYVDMLENVRQIHIVMEYAGTVSLNDYIKGKPGKKLNEIEAKNIFKEIVEGIFYLHKKSIVHRDIKLENLLIDLNKKIKIIDFGFSVKSKKDEKLKIFCGTPSYMAPEIIDRKDYEGYPADVWSLGVLLFKMLTGNFPFRASNERELRTKIHTGKFDTSNMSEGAASLIKKLLKLRAEERVTPEAVYFYFKILNFSQIFLFYNDQILTDPWMI